MSKVAVLFDLDGTLLNTLEDLCDSVNVAMREFSSPERSLAEIRRFVGNGAADLMERSLAGGRGNSDYECALGFFKEYYASHADIKTRPYDGVLDVLRRLLEEGIPCAVVTNKPGAASRTLCDKHFGTLIADSIGDGGDMPRKPAPDKVFHMMRSLGCDRAVFVGDSETDVLTAKNANIPCICVTWGFRDREELALVGGEIFCDDAKGLEEKIMQFVEEMR